MGGVYAVGVGRGKTEEESYGVGWGRSRRLGSLNYCLLMKANLSTVKENRQNLQDG